MSDISLDKNIRAEVFKDILSLDAEKVIILGQEYTCRFTQPSMRRVSQVYGFLNEIVEQDLMVYVSDNEKAPTVGTVVTRSSDGTKYKIIDSVKYDFGNGCYTMGLGKKN